MSLKLHCKELLQYWWIFLLGFILRGFVIIRTSAIDQYLPVKYTDIDYLVFSDASALINQGYSPYDRATYRYSPLLAYFLLPNVIIHEQFGKWLFTLCDIIVSILIFLLIRLLSTQKILPFKTSSLGAIGISIFYLFNPLSINLSTRGSMDVLHITMLYLSLITFYTQYWSISGLIYGLSVHLRIYPIFFAPAIFTTFIYFQKNSLYGFGENKKMMMINDNNIKEGKEQISNLRPLTTTRTTTRTTKPIHNHPSTIMIINPSHDKEQQNKEQQDKEQQEQSQPTSYQLFFQTLFHPNAIKFIGTCIIINIILLWIFYIKFGYQFLYETYLFHLIRKDTRHNFSPLFYFTYLKQDLMRIVSQQIYSFVDVITNNHNNNNNNIIKGEMLIEYSQTIFQKYQQQQQQSFFSFLSIFNPISTLLTISWSLLSNVITFILLGILPLINTTTNKRSLLLSSSSSSQQQQHQTKQQQTKQQQQQTKQTPFPLPIIFLILSLWFVCKNAVITAQYFLWFIAFVPMYLPYLFCERDNNDNSNNSNDNNENDKNNDNSNDKENKEQPNKQSNKQTTQSSLKPTITAINTTTNTTTTAITIKTTTSSILSNPITFKIIKLILSCLFWLISELLWLATGFFVEVRGIGGMSWVLMNIASVWLYLVHWWIFMTITVHVLDFNSISDALGYYYYYYYSFSCWKKDIDHIDHTIDNEHDKDDQDDQDDDLDNNHFTNQQHKQYLNDHLNQLVINTTVGITKSHFLDNKRNKEHKQPKQGEYDEEEQEPEEEEDSTTTTKTTTTRRITTTQKPSIKTISHTSSPIIKNNTQTASIKRQTTTTTTTSDNNNKSKTMKDYSSDDDDNDNHVNDLQTTRKRTTTSRRRSISRSKPR